MKSAKIFMYDRYAGILKKKEACFKCQRSKLQVPTKPASFAIETIFIFLPIFPHYFPLS